MKPAVLSVLAALTVLAPMTAAQPQSAVKLVRLPAGGIQPQARIDARGVIHAAYFVGEPANGDLYYATRDGANWSTPIRINSETGSAIAVGSVRGVRLALGRDGRAHVAWNGSNQAAAKTAGGANPMLYARLDPRTRTFSPQRNVMQFAAGLDGGSAIAADDRGRVAIAWHAAGPAVGGNEGDRRVWLTQSTDDGATFSRERAISDPSTGACGCCGMDGLIDRNGRIFFLYRSARETVHRDTYVLMSTDKGEHFGSARLDEWNIGGCPMSTFAFGHGPDGVLAAWETEGQVRFTRVGVPNERAKAPVEAPGSIRGRRFPSLAVNARGDILLVWTEGTGWNKGGSVAWQVFDRDGKPTGEAGRAGGVQVWGLAAAVAQPSGGFVIVY